MMPNLVKSSLMGKIQDQSVSTYVLDSLSVLTLATGIKQVMPFSKNYLNILPDIMAYVTMLLVSIGDPRKMSESITEKCVWETSKITL
jgi:hypothetical protein